jgi:transmembrane sensor
VTTSEKIDDQAASWILLEEKPDWDMQAQLQRDSWLEEAPAHRIAYLRLKDAWTRADRLRALKGLRWDGISGDVRSKLSDALTKAAAALLVGLLGAGVAWRLIPDGTRYSTPLGVTETVNLSDGTMMQLGTNTDIETKVTSKERRIVLEKGEVYFEVIHDAKRPFTVLVGGKRITDLGTKFSVRLDGDSVHVIVAEGEVKVENLDTNAPAVIAEADTQVTTGPDAVLLSATTERQISKALSWRTGYLVFDRETLADVAAEFNRYNDRKLVIGSHLEKMKIGGTFKAANVSDFASLLHDTFGLTVERNDKEIKISR